MAKTDVLFMLVIWAVIAALLIGFNHVAHRKDDDEQ